MLLAILLIFFFQIGKINLRISIITEFSEWFIAIFPSLPSFDWSNRVFFGWHMYSRYLQLQHHQDSHKIEIIWSRKKNQVASKFHIIIFFQKWESWWCCIDKLWLFPLELKEFRMISTLLFIFGKYAIWTLTLCT